MATYYVRSGATGAGNGTDWANAYTTLTTAFSGKAAGDVFYVAADHAESTAGAINLTTVGTLANPAKVICVDHTGSVPPVAADLRATATVTTTSATNSIGFLGCTHYHGIIFTSGSGATTSIINIANAVNLSNRFDNCSLRVNGTTSGTISVGGGTPSGGNYVELNNTTVSFAVATGSISVNGFIAWRNTPSALLGTIPTSLFLFNTGRGGRIDCNGVDFSAAGSGKTLVGNTVSGMSAIVARFTDCKLNASVTKVATSPSHGAIEADFIRCSSSGINYTVHRNRYTGTLDEETTIVRTGGASDGTTPIAWKVVTTANVNWFFPFECPPIAIWNDTTGSAKTATVEGIWGGGAVPNDDEIWVEVEYLGDASTPQGSFVNDSKATILTTAAGQSSSSATWGGSTTKFKLDVSFTAQQKGWIYCRVRCAKASSTFYVDPLVTLT